MIRRLVVVSLSIASPLVLLVCGTTVDAGVIYEQERSGFSTTDGIVSQKELGSSGVDNFAFTRDSRIRGISFSFAALGGPSPTFMDRKWVVRFFESDGGRPGSLLKKLVLN